MAAKKSNLALGWGTKGSKFWMQMVACFPKLSDYFTKELEKAEGRPVQLTWVSPCAARSLEEYSLRQKTPKESAQLKMLKDFLGETKEFWDYWPGNLSEPLKFWPVNQPQWDGIAIYGNTLYIIEAKAYPEEMETVCSASKDSKDIICDSLEHARKSYVGSQGKLKENKLWWQNCGDEKGYYQLANRLTYLKFLNEKLKETSEKRVKLVLLNFLSDYTHGMKKGKLKKNDKLGDNLKKPVETIWEDSYKNAWLKMLGTETAPADVIVVNYDVEKAVPGIRFITGGIEENGETIVTYRVKPSKEDKKAILKIEGDKAHCYDYLDDSKDSELESHLKG